MKQDQKLLSAEKHESAYVKKIARSYITALKGVDEKKTVSISVGRLRRLCKRVVKT